jgi:[pyruvate, water dikinase]-phosphate phosphotransferase / [pyruvate, water dikinase] kinase
MLMLSPGATPVFHLVSDSTGETASKVMRACLSQFEVRPLEEYLWSFVRSPVQAEEVMAAIEANPGFVLLTLVEEDLRRYFQQRCQQMELPYFSLLEPLMNELECYLGNARPLRAGRQYKIDDAYFRRMDAVDFAVNHDDGHGGHNLADADVLLLGVSRMSKTPTCIYLAYRGIKAANIPLFGACQLSEGVEQLLVGSTVPLIVGLTQDPAALVAIRRNRMAYLTPDQPLDYVDPEKVQQEVMTARRLFARHGWPVIDVTRRSVEETATLIIQMLHKDHRIADLVF